MDSDELRGTLFSGVVKTRIQQRSRVWPRRVTAIALCGIALIAYWISKSSLPRHYIYTEQESGHTSSTPEPYNSQWAQYAPYRPVAEYEQPPEACKITQVNILQRHGARFPTTGAAQRIISALSKLQTAKAYTDPSLEFLKKYKYQLGTDDLLQYGIEESYNSGIEAFSRYSKLVGEDMLPFVRSDISQRDIDSALYWTAGFSAASKDKLNPNLSVITGGSANNTLDGSQCPAAGRADEQTDQWLSIYAPTITAELNTHAHGAELNDRDTHNLISLCPFETLAYSKKSPWCTLFEGFPHAFSGFEYTGDLDKYYKTGYGQRLGPVQGVGYVNELLARLTESPVQDETQTNHTLDDSPATFPLDRTLYVDFSHDNQMIAIFSAMGLFREHRPLNPREADAGRIWKVGAMVPFAGRMVVERLSCARPTTMHIDNADATDSTEVMVRILVQDEVQPLEFCVPDGYGMCTLNAFVQSQAFSRHNGDGDWEKCFE